MAGLSRCIKTKSEQKNLFGSTSNAFGGAFPINFPLGCDKKFVVKHKKNMKKKNSTLYNKNLEKHYP